MTLKLKHKIVKAGELLSKDNLLIPASFMVEQLPRVEAKNYGVYGGQAFNKANSLILINKIQAGYYGVDSLTVYYTTKEQNYKHNACMCYVHKDQPLAILTGSFQKKMLRDAEKLQIKNLNHLLPHYMLIGSDPEIFVEDEKGEVIPSFNFLGKKGSCVKTQQGLGVYWDGPQAEFETKPEGCLAYQIDSIQFGMKTLLQEARKYNPKAKLSTKTLMGIPKEVLDTAAEEHIQLGCMPSLNAYDMKSEPVENGRHLPFRSAGGHIHFGMNRTPDQFKLMVKALDAILGVACVSLFQSYDNPARRRYYGMAGEYRLPKHGMEYRTLSNAWLIHPLLTNLVFDLSRKCTVMAEKGFMKYWIATEEEVIKCINECDVKLSQEILKRNKETFIKMFQSCYGIAEENQLEGIFNIFMNGLDVIIKNPNDIEGNWNLSDGKWSLHCENPGATFNEAKVIIAAKKKVA